MEEILKKLGFVKNTKPINGFIPHYVRQVGDKKDVLFLIKARYWISKIVLMEQRFHAFEGKVFGVIMPDAPHLAAKDWVVCGFHLLKIDSATILIGEWDVNGVDIKFTEIDNI